MVPDHVSGNGYEDASNTYDSEDDDDFDDESVLSHKVPEPKASTVIEMCDVMSQGDHSTSTNANSQAIDSSESPDDADRMSDFIASESESETESNQCELEDNKISDVVSTLSSRQDTLNISVSAISYSTMMDWEGAVEQSEYYAMCEGDHNLDIDPNMNRPNPADHGNSDDLGDRQSSCDILEAADCAIDRGSSNVANNPTSASGMPASDLPSPAKSISSQSKVKRCSDMDNCYLNGLFQGTIPECLVGLTVVEVSMIALINPITTVRLEGNSHFVAKTPVYTIMNNVQKIANQLPRRLTLMDFAILRTFKGIKSKDYSFRPSRVIAALYWLKRNNIHYSTIKIITPKGFKDSNGQLLDSFIAVDAMELSPNETTDICDKWTPMLLITQIMLITKLETQLWMYCW
jgi:hypothetical protein